MVNLGPTFAAQEQDLWQNLLETSNFALEKPSGLGIVPLSVLITVSKAIHSWLRISPENLVASVLLPTA